MGKIKIISISKIKNIKDVKKNWIEKGRRDDEIWSNPHSNGDIFSRFFIYIFINKLLMITIINGIKIIIEIIIKDEINLDLYLIIIHIKLYLNFLIGN